jgi:hypothetical protein
MFPKIKSPLKGRRFQYIEDTPPPQKKKKMLQQRNPFDNILITFRDEWQTNEILKVTLKRV